MNKIILFDSAEKYPWDFSFYNYEMERANLNVGDYTIKGMENDFIIERKCSVPEVAINIGRKRKQFLNEWERGEYIKNKYILCEFTIDDIMRFPHGCKIPKSQISRIRINAGFILKSLYEIRDTYNVNLIFCDGRESAIKEALAIFNGT